MGLTIDKLVEVVWYDAAAHANVNKKQLDSFPANTQLIISRTYGYLYKEDKNAVVIVNGTNDVDDMDYVAIPRPWIKEINNYISEKDGKPK